MIIRRFKSYVSSLLGCVRRIKAVRDYVFLEQVNHNNPTRVMDCRFEIALCVVWKFIMCFLGQVRNGYLIEEISQLETNASYFCAIEFGKA